MIDLGFVKPGSTVRIPFGSYTGSTGASSAASNLADADIQVYKDGGTTQRASAAGMVATTSYDSITGINLISIDLADNTTAGFWSAGSEYFVVINPFTIDSQTVALCLARFVIGFDAAILNTTIATLSSQTSFTLTLGPAEDDALNGMVVVIHDVASSVQEGTAVVADYTGSTKTVTLTAGTTFTAAATDNISFFPPGNSNWFNALKTVALPLVPATAGRTLVVDAAGLADANVVKLGPTGSGTAQTAKDVGGAVPAAAAGASGGLLISGSNSGTTTLGALTVTGATTLAAISGTTLTLSGAVAFQSTFAVTTSTALGALSCSTFAASGTVTYNAFTITNNLLISGTTTHTGATTFTGAISGTNAANDLRVNVVALSGTAQTGRDIGASVLLSAGTGAGQLDFTSGVVKANAVQLLGTAWLTPGTAGTPDVNAKLWNGLATVALPLTPTTAGRALDVTAAGNAGIDWGNVENPTTTLVLSGTTIGVASVLSGTVTLADASLTTAKLGTFALAKGTNITGFNDIAATAIVSAGAITTSGGAVVTVTGVTNAVTITGDAATAGTRMLTTLELNAGNYRFTTAALANAPTGSGSGLTAQQTRDAMQLAPSVGAAAAGSIDDQLADIQTSVNAISAGTGDGAWPITIEIVDEDGEPLEGANVRAIQNGTSKAYDVSDALGEVEINLDAGTYTIALTLADFQSGTATLVVSSIGGASISEIEMERIIPPSSPTADFCLVSGKIYEKDGITPMVGASLKAFPTATASFAGRLLSTRTAFQTESDTSGDFLLSVPRTDLMNPPTVKWKFIVDEADYEEEHTTAAASLPLDTLLAT